MELHESQILAQNLMSEYGLNAKGWTFEFDRAKKRFGQCRGYGKVITLSAYLTLLNSEADVKNTILHEIAHALVGCGNGHNRVWKNKMREMGLKPDRCYDSSKVNQPKGKYTYKCDNCETTVEKYRKPRKVYACANCCNKYNGGRYSMDFLFKLQGL